MCIIDMTGAVTEEVDHMQEQMGNISREKEGSRKNQKEILEIENTVSEMKNVLNGIIR